MDGITEMWPAIIAFAIAATILPIKVWIGILITVITALCAYSFIYT